ncbi:DUF3991 domain-containing protein [Anaerotruncus sp. AF02-27]|uniref:DUF3991 and toprim domain-containing protein n=1 Tax=Anaerotruncus sp. AF02-27 TaxID=2292191 RepID=UPI000E50B052|nr:DUF3991 and toprim domain-containing protein [Anaerotruncus sp. AF02-27]RGX56782.1 DUF3991 domain-containing protein [Anaerotruncus sp. AF02-27]
MGGIIYYGKYTKDQVERANQIDLEELLRRNGEKLLPSGREKRLENDHSVTIRGNQWFDHAAEQGGYSLSFVRQHYGLSFSEGMKLLLGEDGQRPLPIAESKPKSEPKPFALPKSAGTMRRVYGYLQGHRKIDRELLTAFARAKLIYEDTPYHNAVFVGCDERGVPRHAHKRSTNSEGKAFRINVEGSDPACSFHWSGRSDKLFVFEAPIDLLSYISLYPEGWQQHSYVSLCGVAEHAMVRQLNLHPQTREVYLCLDNDKAGHSAAERLTARLGELGGYSVHRLCPQLKDWNDDLKEETEQQETFEQEEKGGMNLAL